MTISEGCDQGLGWNNQCFLESIPPREPPFPELRRARPCPVPPPVLPWVVGIAELRLRPVLERHHLHCRAVDKMQLHRAVLP